MKYRKKPIVVEAMQYTAESCRAIHEWIGMFHEGDGYLCSTGFLIETLEGQLEVKVGDWVIKGVEGEFYPCKPDIFEKTYEAVKE